MADKNLEISLKVTGVPEAKRSIESLTTLTAENARKQRATTRMLLQDEISKGKAIVKVFDDVLAAAKKADAAEISLNKAKLSEKIRNTNKTVDSIISAIKRSSVESQRQSDKETALYIRNEMRKIREVAKSEQQRITSAKRAADAEVSEIERATQNALRASQRRASQEVKDQEKAAREKARIAAQAARQSALMFDKSLAQGIGGFRSILSGFTDMSAGFNKMWFFGTRVLTVSRAIVGTITKFGLIFTGAAAAAGGLAAVIGGKLFSSVMKVSEEFRKLQVTQLGVFKTVPSVNKISQWAHEYSATRPGTYEETMQMITSLSLSEPLKKRFAQNQNELTKVADLIQSLAVLNPGPTGGIAGAQLAVKEALAGQFKSLAQRFNVSPSLISNLLDIPDTSGRPGVPLVARSKAGVISEYMSANKLNADEFLRSIGLSKPKGSEKSIQKKAKEYIDTHINSIFDKLSRSTDLSKYQYVMSKGEKGTSLNKALASAKNDPERVLNALFKLQEMFVPKSTLELTTKTLGVQLNNLTDRLKMFAQAVGSGGTLNFVGSDKFGKREGGIYGYATASIERLNTRFAEFMKSPMMMRTAGNLSNSMVNLWQTGERSLGRIFSGVSAGRGFGDNLSVIWTNLKKEASVWFEWVKKRVSELITWITTTGIKAVKDGLKEVNTLIDEMVSGKGNQPKWVQVVITGIDKARDLAIKIKDIFSDQNTTKSMISIAKAFGNVALAIGRVIEKFSKLPAGVQTALATGFLINQSGALQVATGAGKLAKGAFDVASGIGGWIKSLFTGAATTTAVSTVISESAAVPNAVAGGITTAITSASSVSLIGAAVAGAITASVYNYKEAKKKMPSLDELEKQANINAAFKSKNAPSLWGDTPETRAGIKGFSPEERAGLKSKYAEYGMTGDDRYTFSTVDALMKEAKAQKTLRELNEVGNEMRGADEWYRLQGKKPKRNLPFGAPFSMTLSAAERAKNYADNVKEQARIKESNQQLQDQRNYRVNLEKGDNGYRFTERSIYSPLQGSVGEQEYLNMLKENENQMKNTTSTTNNFFGTTYMLTENPAEILRNSRDMKTGDRIQ